MNRAVTDPAALSENYEAYKAWASSEAVDLARAEECFAIEMKRAGVTPPARVLEIGFGAGDFLRWAKAKGYEVCGVELLDESVRALKAEGFNVMGGDFRALPQIAGAQWDAIVAFDVLEHVEIRVLADWFKAFARMLGEKGVLIARFPNCASPFGTLYQHGDATHATALTPDRIRHLATIAGLSRVEGFNAARPLSGRRARIFKRLAYGVRNLVERIVGPLYFGRRIPLDPNVTCFVRR